ncbi:MAG: cell division protein FtsQ/DivIB [Candidatus Faecivicinus sp.]
MRRISKRVIALIAALLVLLAIAAGLLWLKLFVVRNVVIEGAADIPQEEIIRATKIAFGASIAKVDAEKLRANLESTGVYALDDVTVRYPNTVVLSVRQRTRDATVLNGGQYLVMDSDGYVIATSTTLPEDGGVYVYGLGATAYRIGGRIAAPEDRLLAMKRVLDALREQNAMEYVSDLDLSETAQLWMTTRTGLRVDLGGTENMDEKILWMRAAVIDLEARGEIRGTLDVSSGARADYMP